LLAYKEIFLYTEASTGHKNYTLKSIIFETTYGHIYYYLRPISLNGKIEFIINTSCS